MIKPWIVKLFELIFLLRSVCQKIYLQIYANDIDHRGMSEKFVMCRLIWIYTEAIGWVYLRCPLLQVLMLFFHKRG